MSSLGASLITVTSIFAGTLIGMFLGKVLPHDHLQDETKDTVKLASGMIATLAALVLGLLVASAKGSMDTTSADINDAGSKIMLLDDLLSRYGPAADATRRDLHDALAAGIAKIWPEQKIAVSGASALEASRGFATVQDDLLALTPANDAQRALLTQALQITNDLIRSKWLVVERTNAVLPLPFFIVLVSWLTLLFLSIGLFAPRNATALIALFLAGLSFSAAIFLIMEMNHPLDGILRVSDTPLRKVLEHLDQP